jgi:sugar/nucleoside kinase (ribokinase family)
MQEKRFDVVGIGSALVDVIARSSEDFLRDNGMHKGAMRLIGAEEAVALYAKMGPGIETSGGSVPNTCAGIASLGGRAAFIGKVARDQLGEIFAHDIKAIGVTYTTPPSANASPTGRCLILVTPEGERTMNTFLGAAAELGVAELDEDAIASAKILYLEGYSFDPPLTRAAFHEAASMAKRAGTRVAVTLSDPFCVDRHRAAFLDFIAHKTDIVFANEKELLSLYETQDFDQACARLRGAVELAIVTRSEKGSLVLNGAGDIPIPAVPVDEVVDTTGAGDMYAAGFLFGLATGRDLATCGRIASLCAAEVISHIGPRPQTNLAALVRSSGLM